MTCIIGLKCKEGVILGADSAGVGKNMKLPRKDLKVGKVGEYLIAYSASFRFGQIILHCFTPPPVPKTYKTAEKIYPFLVKKFIPALREALVREHFLVGDQTEVDGSLIIGCRGHLFVVEPDFQVGWPHDKFIASGSGEEYALGALTALEGSSAKPHTKVHCALEAAERFGLGVMRPFTLVKSWED